ncbi:MAG: transposase [Planctomycetaceae bacterium]
MWHQQLDECHGACVLRQPETAEIVAGALHHFDGDRYYLDSFIVMPNHVHALVQFRPPTTLRKQLESWLHFSATQINRHLGTRGRFWQSEPFDHLVRSAEQFQYLQRYIRENPEKARLSAGQFLYWSREVTE